MLELFFKGGVVMWIILTFSMLGLGVIIERLVFLFILERGNYNNLKEKVRLLIEKNDIKGAKEICMQEGRAIGKVLYAIIDNVGEDKDFLEEKVREVMLSQIPILEKNMWLLNLTGYISPLLGLLGTVTGMITSFSAISSFGVTKESVAGGISEALINTAFGLLVAIPCIVFYSYFNKKVDIILNELEKSAVEFINIVSRC